MINAKFIYLMEHQPEKIAIMTEVILIYHAILRYIASLCNKLIWIIQYLVEVGGGEDGPVIPDERWDKSVDWPPPINGHIGLLT